MPIKDFLKGTLKVSLAIFIAMAALAGAALGIWAIWNSVEKQSAKQYEVVRDWRIDLQDNLKIDLVARTKLVDGQLMGVVIVIGFPNYLSHRRLGPKNLDAQLTLLFQDGDGFEVYKKELKISDFSTTVDPQGKKIGLNTQFTDYMGVDKYKSFSQLRVRWTLDTDIPAEVKAAPVDKPTATPSRLLDHCAPDISRLERLRRLAQHGTVREVGGNRYSAGDRSVTFFTGGGLLSCR